MRHAACVFVTGGTRTEAITVERPQLVVTHRPHGAGAVRWATVAVGLYIAASLGLHHRVLPDLTTRATGWVSSDSSLFTWWLRWVPWALAHGHSPLYTTWIGAPTGTNAMWNTSVPVLGVLLAPVTLTVGPTAAFNVGMILGPAVSATAVYLALGAWVRSWTARVLGGGLYGFGPFVAVHGAVGHLNLTWSLLPPVLLWAVRAVLVEQRHPWRDGAVLGFAVALQLGLYTQTVALGGVAVVVAAAALVCRWPREVPHKLAAVARSLAAAGGVVAIVCAYPLWLLLAGPGRPHGLIRDPAASGADLLGFVVPTPLVKLQLGLEGPGGAVYGAAPSEAGNYLGVPLLLVAVTVALLVRSPAVRVVAVVGALLGVLSLGERIGEVPLPWRAVAGLPLLGQAEPVRLGAFVAVCLTVLVAVGLDRALDHPGRRWPAVVAIVVAAVTWLPSDSQQTTDAASPAFFTAGAPGLTATDVVATVPRTSTAWVGGARPMLWQAAAGMTYRQVGGYFIGSTPDHPLVYEAPVAAFDRVGGDPVAARRDLNRLGVTTVIVVAQPDVDLEAALRWAGQTTGTPGLRYGDVWLFRRS